MNICKTSLILLSIVKCQQYSKIFQDRELPSWLGPDDLHVNYQNYDRELSSWLGPDDLNVK